MNKMLFDVGEFVWTSTQMRRRVHARRVNAGVNEYLVDGMVWVSEDALLFVLERMRQQNAPGERRYAVR